MVYCLGLFFGDVSFALCQLSCLDVETESDLVSLENTLIRKSRRLIRECEEDYVMTGDEGRIVSNLWTTQ